MSSPITTMHQPPSSYDHLAEAILPTPLQISPQSTLADVFNLMNRAVLCPLPEHRQDPVNHNDREHISQNPGCVLVTENGKLQGILTERDVVRFTMNDIDLESTFVHEVMTTPVLSIIREDFTDLFVVYNLMRRHRVRHLPIVDAAQIVQGLVTISSLRRAINTSYFLRFRQVQEVMTSQVVTVLPTDSVRAAVQRLAAYNISCVVVANPQNVEINKHGSLVNISAAIPIGIITERDILQFKALGLDLNTVTVDTVMSAPLTCVHPEDTLGTVQELMQQLRVRRLVVTTADGYLAGIVTETNLTQVLDPLELYGILEILQLQLCNVSESRNRLLKARNFDLKMAFDRQEFRLVYQPQLELSSHRIIGAEALTRWHSDELGEVSPLDFIPWAEQTNFIIPLGYWILETACRQMMQWRDRNGCHELFVAVNISSKQLMDHGFVPRVMDILKVTGLPPQCLKLELTESVLVDSITATAEKFKQLQGLGVQIAIDDFGTGYASLSYLQHFHFDILKIDRSFIREIDHDPKKQAIVSSILRMAKQLKFKVVAEGVETEAEQAFLQVRDCHYIQGFWLSRPLEVQDWASFMDNHNGAVSPRPNLATERP